MDKSNKLLLERQDEELVKQIQNGDRQALEVLYARYYGLIYEISYKFMFEYNVAQMYFDDLVDTAIDGLLIATKKFMPDKDNSFLNFWWAIVDRRHMTFLQKIIQTRMSPYDPYECDNLSNELSDSNLETHLGVGVSLLETIHKEINAFSREEKIFLEYYILGYKPLEIAEFFSWNRQKLYRIKKKAMDKLNKIIKSN